MQYVSFMLNVFGNGFEYETNILISRRFFKMAIKILNWGGYADGFLGNMLLF